MTKTTYTNKGKTYNEVCSHLGWMPEIHAILIHATSTIVYATGTLLKPQEWRTLRSHSGDTLPSGRTLRITHVPRDL